MQSIQGGTDGAYASCNSKDDAIKLIEQALHDEYGATLEASRDDKMHSQIVWPNIVRLRAVAAFLRALPITVTLISLEPWLTRAGMRLSDAFFLWS